jgi:D-threo-aldose 1-dehydrogenase
MMDWFLDRFDLDFFLVAMPYTLLDQAALKVELARCAERDIAVVIGAPFASGLLASGPGDRATYGYAAADPEIIAKARSVARICTAHGVPLAAAALQFPLAHPSVAAVIPGATRAAMVTENTTNLRREIPMALWQELIYEGLIDAQAPAPASGWQRA